MDHHDRMPIIEVYKGVDVHDFQPRERIELIVKPAIDRVHAMSGLDGLVAYLKDAQEPPEARLLGYAKVRAAWELAAENREVRPALDMDHLRACVVGLDSLGWADQFCYGTLFQAKAPGEHRPERTLEHQIALERARARLR